RMPTRIQRRRTRGWRMPSGAVYVGRGSRWGNPYRVARVGGGYVVEGPGWGSSHARRVEAQQVAVERYRVWVVHQSGFVDRARARLAGCELACWCAPGVPCHADVLLGVANADYLKKPASVDAGGFFLCPRLVLRGL